MKILSTWSAVAEEFRFDSERLATFEKCLLLMAASDLDGYEGDAFVLYERDGMLYEVNSRHCSCDNFTWNPEVTTLAYYWRWIIDVRSGKAKGFGVKFACINEIAAAINVYAKKG